MATPSFGTDAEYDAMAEKPSCFADWGWYDWTMVVALGGIAWAALYSVGWVIWEMIR